MDIRIAEILHITVVKGPCNNSEHHVRIDLITFVPYYFLSQYKYL